MKKKLLVLLVLFLLPTTLLLPMGESTANHDVLHDAIKESVGLATPVTIWIPEDFTTIQEAVDAANPGDTVRVAAGVYYEHVTVNKTLALIGENTATTIIDGNGTGVVLKINAIDVHVENLTLANAGYNVSDLWQPLIDHVGLVLVDTSNASVVNVTSTGNSIGFYILDSIYSILQSNTVSHNHHGVLIFRSENISMKENNFVHNDIQLFGRRGLNLIVRGFTRAQFIHGIDSSNKIDGKSIYYLVDKDGARIPSDAGYVAVVNSSGITVEDLTLKGVLLAYANKTTIRNVTVLNVGLGIEVWRSSGIEIVNNTIKSNFVAVFLGESNSSFIAKNILTLSSYAGIGLGGRKGSHDNFIVDNVISNSTHGIDVVGSNNTMSGNRASQNINGILLDMAVESNVENNIVSNNEKGIHLMRGSSRNNVSGNIISENSLGMYVRMRSDDNTIFENNFTANSISMYIENSWDSTVYHNNFINNSVQAYSEMRNFWDNGYPYGGNYWSDYTGDDTFSGIDQDQLGGDGMGDTPYRFEVNNQDRYPLIETWASNMGTRDVALLAVTSFPNEAYAGWVISFNVTLWNRGDRIENRTVTVYLDSILMGTQPVPVGVGQRHSLTFSCDTAKLTPGNYTVKAVVNIVPGEAYIDDNSLTNGVVRIKILGDVDGDNKVDIKDIAQAALAFGSYPHHPRWNIQADINQDGRVDIIDLALIALNFGKTYS